MWRQQFYGIYICILFCLRFIKYFPLSSQFIRSGPVVGADDDGGGLRTRSNLFDDGCRNNFAISILEHSERMKEKESERKRKQAWASIHQNDMIKNVLCWRIIPMLIRNNIFFAISSRGLAFSVRTWKIKAHKLLDAQRRDTLNLFIYLALARLFTVFGLVYWQLENAWGGMDNGVREQNS